MEVAKVENTRELVNNWVERYNEQFENKVTFYLYEEFLRHLIKVVRGLAQVDGHMIVVGLRGYGISRLISLASFING